MIGKKISPVIILVMFVPVLALAAQESNPVFRNLYTFEDGVTQNWKEDTSDYFIDNLDTPLISSLYAKDGIYSLRFPLNLDPKDPGYNCVNDALYVSPRDKNFTDYSRLNAYIYVPSGANITKTKPLYANIYIKTGVNWAWFESEDFTEILLGEWTELSLDLSSGKNAQGTVGNISDLNNVRELGVRIFGASDSSGSTCLYIDLIQAETFEHITPPSQVTGLKVADPGIGNRLNITWDNDTAPDLAGYYVFRSTVYGEPGELLATRSTNNYSDNGVIDGITYYYQIRAYDIYGNEGEISIQVGNTLSVHNNMFSMEGVSYACWWNNTYETESSDISLGDLSTTGANYVALVVTQYMDLPNSSIIYPDSDKTPTNDSIIHAINTIHSLGMNVMLKPHIDCKDNTWRGYISGNNRDMFFESYNEFITHYAKIAQDNGVELLSIGCELKGISGVTYLNDWEDIISNIRNIYKGSLTYAANWDEYKDVSFWSYLDYAGIDAYFPLSDDKNPSVSELKSGWVEYSGIYGSGNWVDEIENWQKQIHKPVIFTEIGYRSIDYAAKQPWLWQGTGDYNGDLQASCYEATIGIFKNKDWFRGMFWWTWMAESNAGGVTDTGYTPQNKPAQSVLTQWYSIGKSPNKAPQKPSAISGPYCGITGAYYRYKAVSTDPDGDDIEYIFDWGDGTIEETEYHQSGLEVGRAHKWDKEGYFVVRVKVMDIERNTSNWSDTFTVDISKNSSEPGVKAPVDFSQTIVYPNPWKINVCSLDSGITFNYIPDNTSIDIYNIAGELIYKMENVDGNSIEWKLHNNSGESVVSGVYIYLLTDDNGHKKIGKVAVIK